MPKTLESILIERGELERFYRGQAPPITLWRALRTDMRGDNPLYPDFEAREIRQKEFRPPDVDVYTDTRGNSMVSMVKAQLGRGTSLFDKSGVFRGRSWEYFEIPPGTEIPDELIIIKDEFNERLQATHYSICPNFDMPIDRFKQALDTLASNAISRRRELYGN